MKNIVIEFICQHNNKDVYNYPIMYCQGANRLSIQNVVEVIFGREKIFIEYKKTKRAKKTYMNSYNKENISRITIN